MFQKFTTLSHPETAKDRVFSLRKLFHELGVDAILIPKSDEYPGEYIPPQAERLAWLTSFTGSAGDVLVLKDRAIIFTDGRYSAQVIKQCDGSVFSYEDLISCPPSKWLVENGPDTIRLGLDPWTISNTRFKTLQKAIDARGGTLVILDTNPVDKIWLDQPEPPLSPVSIQAKSQAGKLAEDKISDLKTELVKKNIDTVVIADPASIAWIFNIRGHDVIHTPLPLSRAIFNKDHRPKLFIDEQKLNAKSKSYLTPLADIHPPSEFNNAVISLGKIKASILIDPDITPHAIPMIITKYGGMIINGADPASLPRAIKNSTEITGSIEAHKIDGAAMVSFIAWLKSQNPDDLDEISVATRLEKTRINVGQTHQNPLKDISFDTISGSGPNAAIIHYRVDEDSNRQLREGEILLIDSGGQYVNGTTDITRTIGLGTVPDEQKKYFTLVLKGMIEISLLRFPLGTRGVDIDAFARAALWKSGVDYPHGTGHGVGSYLVVHEGPQSISKRSMVELQPGMILSNEPGYYRDGAFGIRIENLIYIHEPRSVNQGDIPMMGFETLTLCPIETDLILPEFLTSEQTNWLNNYHARVWTEISPLLEDHQTINWLKQATKPL